MREIERSSKAVAHARSWHYRMVRRNPADPNGSLESFDKDTYCPSFQRTIQSGARSNGQPVVFDYMIYNGISYSHVGNEWQTREGRPADRDARGTTPIFECIKVIIGGDENSLPFDTIQADGKVKRGGERTVDDDTCRDYDISVPTPGDPVEKEFQFTMCINERDHLPRETRRTGTGASGEVFSTYTQWNAESEPPLPVDFLH